MSFDRRSDATGATRKLLRAIALVAVCPFVFAMVASGCPGTLENKDQFMLGGGGSGGGDCGDFEGVFLQQRCATSSCHDAEMPIGGLDLTNDSGLVMRIRDIDATGQGCTGKLFDSAAPEASLMYTKLTAPTCGSKMPIGGNPLTEQEIGCMLTWLESL